MEKEYLRFIDSVNNGRARLKGVSIALDCISACQYCPKELTDMIAMFSDVCDDICELLDYGKFKTE